MNKKFTKLIAALALLVFLAVPMGMRGQTRTNYVINTTNFEKTNTGSGYAAYNGNHTINGITITSNQVMVNSNKLQFQSNTGYLYNADAMPGNITKITLATATNLTIYVGTSVQPNTTTIASGASISGSYTYFQIKAGSNTPSTATITVEYTSGGGGVSSQTLTFPFTSNISGWPTTNESTLTEHTYTLENVNYIFALKNVKCNTSYLMFTSTAVLGLPAIENYKLTQVVASNSSQCSTSTKVGISSSSSSASYISGGEIKTWSNTSSSYTYNLSSTEANTMYYLYVTNKNAQVVELELTYEYVAPSAVATPTFNLADGYYVGTQNVTISCETDGATIYYTTDGSTPSASNGTQGTSVSISATTTLKAIAIKDEDSSSVAEATYTILTPLTTMQAIYDANTTSTAKKVAITFGNWVITGNNGGTPNKAWLTDNNGKGCSLYQSNIGFIANNVLTGTVICDLARLGNSAQISGITSSSTDVNGNGIVASAPGSVIVVENTVINTLTGVNTGSVVQINNLTCTSANTSSKTYTLTDDNNNTITAKNTVYSSLVLEEGKMYNLTGIYELSYSTMTIYPRSAADILEVVSTDPTISASPESLTGFTYAEGGGPSAVQTITVSGANLEGNIALALNDGENSAFEISLSENSGYANTLNLTQANGTVAETTIYLRLKAGLAIANDYADEINLTSTNAIAKTVSLAGIVTGPEVTWNLATNSYSYASATEVNWTSNYVNMTLAKGQSSTNANNYLGGGSSNHTRMYKDQILTFAPVSGYAISNIEIKAYSTSYANAFVNSTWTNATASASSDIVTIEPTNGNNNVSVTFGSACWAYQVTVYYEVSTATPHNIVNDVDMVNGTVLATPSTAVAGATVTLSIYPDAGYYLESDSDIEVDGSSAITLTKVNDGTFTFVMPDEDVTVYAIFSTYTGTYYTLVNSADDLIPGRHYIIASSKDSGAAYAMAAQGSGYREAVSAIVVGNIIYQTENVHEIVLSGDNTNFWTLYDDCSAVSSQGYLYAGTGNKLNNRTDNSGNNNGKWTISFNEGAVNIVSQIEGTDVSNTVKFNNSTSPKRFSCYTPSSGQMSVYLYMKANETNYELYSNTTFDDLTIGALDIYTVHSPALLTINGTLDNFDCEDPTENLIIEDGAQLYTEDVVEATIKKNISAYDPSLVGQGVSNGWYFISYPLNCDYAGDAPTGVTNMIANPATNYDLYKLVDNTWANYKQNADETNIDPGFTLYTGHGYLYANANDVTLEFAGSVNYTDQDNPGISLENGWNLVGNPYTYIVYPSMPYYKMNDAGTAIESTESTGAIAPCTGILVNNEDGTTTDITFSRTAPNAKGGINLALAEAMRGATQMDNAIVSFNEGSKLGKLYFGTQNANLYIPQGIEEYAIVSTEAQGEMPVNFRANEDGQYTLTVNPENVDMNYLHLIDNMTGMDIDLLQTPSYTFNATTRDYESRFRLVFAANNEDGVSTGSTAFAFFSNGNWIINNAGEATLQVVDLTGRILSSETVNGSVSTTINAVPGVYMLRLINGENVNVQKIVVR